MRTGCDNKVAVITGASSGIGRSIAKALAEEDFQLVITGRDLTQLEATARDVERFGRQAVFDAFDLRESSRLAQLISQTGERFGRLDLLVNAAGVGYMTGITNGTVNRWREMFEVNVIGMLVGSQSAINVMRSTHSEGHIVCISSVAGRMEAADVYGATKAAVDSLCASLRKELETEMIRVVNIVPGLVATNFFRNFSSEVINWGLRLSGISYEENVSGTLSELKLQKLQSSMRSVLASPDDIARAVIYAIGQPQDLNISEILIGPRKTLGHAKRP